MPVSVIHMIKTSFRRSWLFYLLVLAALAAGISLGAVGANRLAPDQARELVGYLNNFVQRLGDLHVNARYIFQTELYQNLVLMGLIYLLGLTVIGLPVVLGLVFIRGFALGFTISFLAGEKAKQGLMLVLTSILPQNLLFIPALLVAGVAAMSFTVLLVRRYFNSRISVWPAFMGYSGLMLVLALLSASAAGVEAYVNPQLIKMLAGLSR